MKVILGIDNQISQRWILLEPSTFTVITESRVEIAAGLPEGRWKGQLSRNETVDKLDPSPTDELELMGKLDHKGNWTWTASFTHLFLVENYLRTGTWALDLCVPAL